MKSTASFEPKGLIRDPARNKAVALPCANRDFYVKGRARADMLANRAVTSQLGDYIFQAGQPKAVREAYLAAMGVTERDLARAGAVRNF